jgi:small GTP-binding protein
MLIEDNRITYRTVLVGEPSVGKTCILNYFLRRRFNPSEQSTIGVIHQCYTTTRFGRDIEMQVWDTAGTEQYRSLTPVYFRESAAAILVYDISRLESFSNLEGWLSLFREASNSSGLVVVVGNKLDLADRRKVKWTDANDWAIKNHCKYTETSAQTGVGIN